MLLKVSSKLRPSIGISQPRMRSRTPSQPRPSSQTPTIRKKFSPTVNKSFTCYKEQTLPKHGRASSLDKTRDNNYSFKHTRTKSLKGSGKTLTLVKESSVLDSAKLEMSYGNYAKALDLLNKYLNSHPSSLDGVYSRGVCFMHLHKSEQAVKDLGKVAEIDPIYDRQLYMALYMCFMTLGQPILALRYLTRGLKNFPGFAQGFLLRGQIYNKSKKFEKALQDFKRVLNLDKKHSEVLMDIAESYIGLKDYTSANKVLNIAISRPEIVQKALICKAKVSYELGNYDEAMVEIDKILASSAESSAFCLKGKILYENQQFTDAVLCFEQAFQGTSDQEIVNTCIFYLGTIKLNERDFYGALHTFERTKPEHQTPELKALNKYTDGVISLMKRKLDESIHIFTEIISENEKSLKIYLGASFENRGFAYFSLKNYRCALDDLLAAKKHCRIEKASEFNIILCEAILTSLKGEDVKALEQFKQCKDHFPKNIMPDLCRASILLKVSQGHEENSHYLDKAESLIDNILATREPECEVLFFCSIVKFYLKNYEDALDNAKRAIEKADENLATHYMHRGLCHAALKKYEESVQDFTIALQLNENLQEVYLFRGICAFLHDDLQLALEDITGYSQTSPQNTTLLLRSAKLLMSMGSYTESLKILHQLDHIDSEKLFLQAKNYLLLFDYEKSLKCIKSLLKSPETNSPASFDKEILQFFISIQQDPNAVFHCSGLSHKLKLLEGKLFTQKYAFWLSGVLLFYQKQYTAAGTSFQTVLEILHDEEPEIFADSISIEEENCEVLYNLALCSLCGESSDSKSHALMILEELSEVLNEKHRGQLLFLSAILELTQKNKAKAEKLLKEALKCDPETLAPFLDNKSTSVLPLHTANEFSSMFPLVAINLDSLPTVFIRPAIALPRAQLDCYLGDVLGEIRKYFGVENINPRPEAPWLLRVKGTIQFTQNILELSHDLETEADENNGKVEEERREKTSGRSKSQNCVRENAFASDESQNEVRKKGRLEIEIDIENKIKNLCND